MTNEFNPDWMCVCGDLTTLGVVHRKDGPCYIPEPKREWVGLTDEEIDQGLLRSDYALQTAHAWRAGVVFAMTQLKEKNNG